MSLNEHRAVFYNEWDKKTASWLKELIKHGRIPFGKVNTHSITELVSTDLLGYKQCHFFAGIGGWPLALRMAGLEDMSGVWTGSPPCQPFSLAGKGKALDDERHLAPIWIQLIRESKPTIVLGEQVEAAIKFGWLDDLFDALENIGYACVSAALPACSVGAPHLRKRLFFGAIRLADANSKRLQGGATLIRKDGKDRTFSKCSYLAKYGIETQGEKAIRINPSGLMLIGSNAQITNSGQLNLEHSRWLMGYPQEWDDCAAMAMP